MGTKAAFDACDFADRGAALATTSPYTYKASKAGVYYFGCSIGGHCKADQKLALTVTEKKPAAKKDIDWKLSMTAAEKAQSVKIGTDVVFTWLGGAKAHGVKLFKTKAAFDACDFADTGAALATTSPYTYKASKAGVYYFGCSIGGHCKADQKLALTVTSDLTTAAPGTTKAGTSGADTAVGVFNLAFAAIMIVAMLI